MLRTLLLPLVLASLAGTASAAADCTAHPESARLGIEPLRDRLRAAGYQIKSLKADGNCYELYGRDIDGRKVEIYFDTATGKPVKSFVQE